jgi:hypothetical protein
MANFVVAVLSGASSSFELSSREQWVEAITAWKKYYQKSGDGDGNGDANGGNDGSGNGDDNG